MIRRDLPRQPHRRQRGGFTMVELLIVITIIAILAGLLLVGVQGGIRRARVAQVVAEVKNLEQALKQFEAAYGVQPPSSILLHKTAAGWQTTDPAMVAETRASKALLRQIWPNFDFSYAGSSGRVELNGDTGTDYVRLNGAECLVFFLGGIPQVDTSTTPSTVSLTGFSKAPGAPFKADTGTRTGPFHEFNTSRFVDLDNDSSFEYLDSLPGQTKPFLYLSSYEGQGYRPYGMNRTQGDDDDELPTFTGAPRWIYTQTPGSSATSPAQPYNPKTFQIISPGPDGEYGIGGVYRDETGVTEATMYLPNGYTPATVVRDAAALVQERDNITNFGELH